MSPTLEKLMKPELKKLEPVTLERLKFPLGETENQKKEYGTRAGKILYSCTLKPTIKLIKGTYNLTKGIIRGVKDILDIFDYAKFYEYIRSDRKYTPPKVKLYRIDKMIERGLVEEVKKLMDMGYSPDLPSMSSIGYRQIREFIEGRISLEAATQQIKFESHRLVRQQYNWFSLKDDRIRWFDVHSRVIPEISALVDRFIKEV